jgi:hypothetical protein
MRGVTRLPAPCNYEPADSLVILSLLSSACLSQTGRVAGDLVPGVLRPVLQHPVNWTVDGIAAA